VSGWETLTCINHPERVALERCEVCHKPLCAYCLYYTADGQRLCQDHAEEARARGAQVEEPGAYAEQLIGAQVGASRKAKRSQHANDENLYRGNSHDLGSFVGMLLALITVASCCGAGYCLPIVAFVLSLVGLFNAGKAFDPRRTRKYSIIGLLVSGGFVLVIVGCIALYSMSFSSLIRSASNSSWWPTVIPYVTDTPSPTSTPVITPTTTPPEPTETPAAP
jgi:hypothetical protein